MDEQETKEKERLEMLGLANCYIYKEKRVSDTLHTPKVTDRR